MVINLIGVIFIAAVIWLIAAAVQKGKNFPFKK